MQDNPDAVPTRLYLLIEEAPREFESRILIASLAIDQGFDVVIAPQWMVWENLTLLEPGIILFKGGNAAQALRMRRAKDAGFQVAIIDEEAFGISNREEILSMWDRRSAEACDLLLAQGTFHADCMAAHHPSRDGWIEITGNPRADLLRPPFSRKIRQKADEIRSRWGDFVLFNTNFGAVNPRRGDAVSFLEVSERVGTVDARKRADVARHLSRLTWERGNLAAMLRVIAMLRAERFPWRMVVRPHPAENIEHWRIGLAGVPGVEIIREGDHRAWGLAARLLVHSSSTTGLEGYLLGGQVFSLCTHRSPWNDIFTSNLVNRVFEDEESAVGAIIGVADRTVADPQESRRFAANLAAHVHTEPNSLAAKRVVDALDVLRRRSPAFGNRVPGRAPFRVTQVDATKVEPSFFEVGAARDAATKTREQLGLDTSFDIELAGPWMLRMRGRVEARQ